MNIEDLSTIGTYSEQNKKNDNGQREKTNKIVGLNKHVGKKIALNSIRV